MSTRNIDGSLRSDHGTAAAVIVERLLLFHRRFPELCQGQPLDETASNAEFAEAILFYYDYNENDSAANGVSSSKEYDRDDVIAFLGLCQALYGLPNTLSQNSTSDNGTHTVTLKNTTLLFVPLVEDSSENDILAVVQVNTTLATPSAVRAALQKSHRLFGWLRGTIRERLGCMDNFNDNDTVNDLKKVYGLQKQIRKARQRLERSSGSDESAEQDRSLIRSAQEALAELKPHLAVTKLRHDLRIHFETWIDDLTQLGHVGSGRHVVQSVPPPARSGAISMDSRMSSLLLMALPDVVSTVNERIHAKRLHGIAAFNNGQLLGRFDVSAASGTSNLFFDLYDYMTTYQRQLASQQHDSSVPNRVELATSRHQRTTTLNPAAENELDAHSASNFAAPPPLALLSALDEENAFRGPDKRQDNFVWLPLVFADTGDSVSRTAVRFCLLTVQRIDFLLSLESVTVDPDSEEHFEAYAGLLHIIQEQITDVVNSMPRQEPLAPVSGALGQYAIFVDRRRRHANVIMPPRSRQAAATLPAGSRTPPRDARSQRFGLLSPPQPATSVQSTVMDEALLDGRHFLARALPLDALLSLDDAIDRVKQSTTRASPFESCTYLKGGWAYAWAHNEHELYAWFEAASHVTIADVQHAAQRLRQRYIR